MHPSRGPLHASGAALCTQVGYPSAPKWGVPLHPKCGVRLHPSGASLCPQVSIAYEHYGDFKRDILQRVFDQIQVQAKGVSKVRLSG